MSDSDIFVNDDSNQEIKERPQKIKGRTPPGYLPISLCTVGKLSAPPKLHFKNYTGEHAVNLSLANEDNILDILIEILNDLVYEDFDCGQLHEKELEEVMMNIYVNYWQSHIEYEYSFSEEELEELSDNRREAIKSSKEKPTVLIPANSIKSNPLPDDFKEPIVINKEGSKKIALNMARIGDTLLARDYVAKVFNQEREKLINVEREIKKAQEKNIEPNITGKEYEMYEDYAKRRLNFSLKVQYANLIHSIDGKELKNLEEKLKVYKNDVDLGYWNIFNNFIENLNFGIQNKIEVKSPLTGKPVTRRFQFQFVDFLPSVESEDTQGYSISFGE
jgi:hypothetical protein